MGGLRLVATGGTSPFSIGQILRNSWNGKGKERGTSGFFPHEILQPLFAKTLS
ncbi:hypothetical protein LguiB_027949 [Lonicera macranthoides]